MLALALGLLPVLGPGIAGMIGRWLGGTNGEAVAGQVVDAVEAIAGGTDAVQVRRAMADPDKAGALLVRIQEIAAAREAAKDQVVLDTLREETQRQAAQIEANKLEAGSQSRFVAGWRPFIGWVCGAALCVEFLVRPVLSWALPSWPAMPQAGEGLWVVVTGILGLGAMRSYDKAVGTAPLPPAAPAQRMAMAPLAGLTPPFPPGPRR